MSFPKSFDFNKHMAGFTKYIEASQGLVRKYGVRRIPLLVEGDIDNKVFSSIGRMCDSPFIDNAVFRPIAMFGPFVAYCKSQRIDIGNCKAYDYIIGIIEKDNSEYWYGIIDNDLDQHSGVDQGRNLAIVETHDQETMLFIYYFDKWFHSRLNEYGKKNVEIELLQCVAKVLDFTVRQGILEHISIQIGDNLILQDISHKYFLEDINGNTIKRMPFDAELENAISKYGGAITQASMISVFREQYQDDCLMEENVLGLVNDVVFIKRWVDGGLDALSSDDLDNIEKACWYMNGHLLFRGLAACLMDCIPSQSKVTEDIIGNQFVGQFKKNPHVYYKSELINKCKGDLKQDH